MSTTHHTPYAFGAALTSTVMNAPLGQLDQAITDISFPVPGVTYNAVGGGADDAANLRTLVASLSPGTTIYLPDDLYCLKTKDANSVCVPINEHNITFIGKGTVHQAEAFDDGTLGRGTTAFVVSGTGSGGVAFQWFADKGANTTNDDDMIVGGGMRNLSIYGSGGATIGIELQAGVVNGVFENLHLAHFSSAAFVGGTGCTHSTTVHGWHGCFHHLLRNVNIHTYGSSHGYWFKGNPNVAGGEDTYGWRIYGGGVFADNGDACRAEDCDDMFLDGVGLSPTGSGQSLRLMAPTSTKTGGGARNVIWKGANGAVDKVLAEGGATGQGSSRMNMIVAGATEDRTGIPTISAGAQLWTSLDQGRMTGWWDSRLAEPPLVDTFMRGSNSSSSIGELGWFLNAGTVTYRDGEAGHHGIRRVDTTTSSGTLASLSAFGSGSIGPLLPADTFIVEYIFRLTQVDSDTMFRIGLGMAYTADPPTNGIYIEKVYADTQLFAVCRSGGSQTRSTAIITPSAGTWYHAYIWRKNSADIGFAIGEFSNWSAQKVVTANVPTATLSPIMQIKNQTAASKTFDIDHFQQVITGYSRI